MPHAYYEYAHVHMDFGFLNELLPGPGLVLKIQFMRCNQILLLKGTFSAERIK